VNVRFKAGQLSMSALRHFGFSGQAALVPKCFMPTVRDPLDLHVATAALPTPDRIDSIDALRGIALFGVLTVNLVTEFRVSIFQQFLPSTTSPTSLSALAEAFVSFALEFKAFSLFSILFGVGLAMQMERLSRGNRPYYLLTRRLVALLGFGLLHLVFVWNGDILTEYALAGLLLLPLLGSPLWLLATTSVALFALYAAIPILPPLVALPDSTALASHVALANHVYSTGNHFDVWRFNVQELMLILPLLVWVFPRTLALILLGACIWRSGVLRQPAMHRRGFLCVGLIGVIAGIVLTLRSTTEVITNLGLVGLLLQALAPVVFALGYGGCVLWFAQRPGAKGLLAPVAAVGRMAFTNYILQSVIFGYVFFGYGLGLFGKMGAAPVFLLGVVVYGFQAALSIAWLRRFRFGPFERIWRGLMYGRMPPLRWKPNVC
jgi:uncharacterized protein